MRALRVALTIAVTSSSTHAEPTERFPDAPPAPRQAPIRGTQELLERGLRHEEAGRFEAAASAFTEAVRLDPSNGAALVALGRLRVRMNDPREAESIFSAATGLSDVASQAFAERARLRKAHRRDDEAILDLERAVALSPDETTWAEELAGWYVARRAWLPALSIYRRLAIDLHGTESEKRATLEVRALRILSGDLDPATRGRMRDYSFIRRALGRLADK